MGTELPNTICYKSLVLKCARAEVRQDLSRTYLAHHELESVLMSVLQLLQSICAPCQPADFAVVQTVRVSVLEGWAFAVPAFTGGRNNLTKPVESFGSCRD